MITLRSHDELLKLERGVPDRARDARRGRQARSRRASTTAELDRLAEAEIRRRAPGRRSRAIAGYPATLCTSVNDEVVHGIPGAAL